MIAANDGTSGEGTNGVEQPTSSWLMFDIHDRLGIRVDRAAPTASLLEDMFQCFRTEQSVPDHLTISEAFEAVGSPSFLENDYIYSDMSLEMRAAKVQVVSDGDRFRLHGSGELLTSTLPLIDRMLVQRSVGMIHAATVCYGNHGIALPAAGGTGKTSTMAKLMKQPKFAFMGDDWAFLTDRGRLLGFAKPMFIKPHHRPIYPHLFQGARKPMVPVSLSRPVGKLTTIAHPVVSRYPRVARVVRRWSPEHRMVHPSLALPNAEVRTSAMLSLSVYFERFDGDRVQIEERDADWMLARMMGNFHVEMPHHSQELVSALGAVGIAPLHKTFGEKADIIKAALADKPAYVMKVPRAMLPDRMSDEMVRSLIELLEDLGFTDRAASDGTPS
jgi:hypothetical protein